jgi:phage gpG-like protein
VAAIGIQGTEAEDDRDGISNAHLGAIQEFGLIIEALGINIPERSFMRAVFDQKAAQAVRLVGKRLKSGDSLEKALGIGAEWLKAQMVRAIDAGIPPPNAPSTVAAKGSSKPLIDSGQLKQSITSEVRGG